MGYYGYGYGYDYNPLSSILSSLGIFGALTVISFIAAIVCAVIFYRKYASDDGRHTVSFGDKTTWGPFLRFDTLLIDKILRALYLFSAFFVAFFSVTILISLSTVGGPGLLIGLIAGAINLVIGELITRLAFESTMLNVIIANNTTDIRRHLDGNSSQDAGNAPEKNGPVPPSTPVQPPRQAPSPAQPSPSPSQPAVPSYPQQPASPSYPQQTVALTPQNRHCPNCGAEVAPGAHFCKVCGTKLD